MGNQPNVKQKAPAPNFFDVAEEISIAADLVGCLYMAANSPDVGDGANPMMRVASIATDHLANATRMIEAMLDGESK